MSLATCLLFPLQSLVHYSLLLEGSYLQALIARYTLIVTEVVLCLGIFFVSLFVFQILRNLRELL